MFNDTVELSGARMAPGSAHRRIVWTGEPPWWINRKDYESVSVQVPELMTAAQALDAMGRYTLEKASLTYQGRNGLTELKGRYGIIRSDTGECFEDVAVSDTFQLIQPEDALGTSDAIVKDHSDGAHYEVIGELAGGRDLWAAIRLQQILNVAGEDIKPYLMFYTAHDGTSSAKFKNVAQRPECRNTLQLALRENAREVRVRHSGNISDKLKEAARVMRAALGYMSEFETFANQLARTPFGQNDYGKLTEHLFPLPDEKGRAQTNAIRARELFLEAVLADNLNNLRNTAWGALNAVSDYNEHARRIRNHTDNVDVKLERIFRRSFEDFAIVDKAQDFILALTRG